MVTRKVYTERGTGMNIIRICFGVLGLTVTILISVAATVVHGMDKGTFSGSWVATGSIEPISFEDKREVALFRLSGHVNLKDKIGNQQDYWSECIGLSDSVSGSDGRCTWKGTGGQEIYLILKGKRLARGSEVNGTIIGGTGTATGITGSLSFIWSTMSVQPGQDSMVVGGYAKEFKGEYKLP